MKLIVHLHDQITNDESYFRQYLAKEDAARVEKLIGAAGSMTRDQYLKDAFLIGWSKDDMRTHELKETLVPLMNAIFDYVANPNEMNDISTLETWHAFHAQRLKVLIHCL